jgi:Flp pilus assembly pilin Flp
MPAALAAMIEDRRVDSTEAAAEAARLAAWIPLSPSAWREIQGRAATLGIRAELLSDGTEVRLVAELGPADAESESRTGQGIVEYGLILGLTSMLTIVILVFFASTVAQILAAVGTAIDQAG